MEKNVNKYTLLNTIGRFFSLILKSFDAWGVTLFYGAVITALSSAFALVRFCKAGDFNCYVTINLFLSILVFITVLFYLYDFYQTVFKNSVFKINNILKLDKNKIKSLVLLICYILCFIVSAFVSWKIFTKPANPDWRVEFIYFTIFFIFCVAPLLAMRFSALIAFYFYEYKIPSFKYLYNKTEGRSYIGIIGFLMVLLILTVFNMYIQGITMHFIKLLPLSTAIKIIGSFVNISVVLFSFSMFFCFFEAQRQLMDENDREPSKDEASCSEVEKTPLSTSKSQKKTAKKINKGRKKK